MKKIPYYFVMILVMLLTLSCCDFNSEKPSAEETEKSEFTVTFDTRGGTPIESVTVQKGEKIPAQLIPQKPGYNFLNWYKDGEKWTLYKDPVTEDMTLTAEYKPIEYTIAYELSGGEFSGEVKESYTVEDQEYALPTPKNGMLKFYGWFSDGEKIDSIKNGSMGNITVTALFYDSLVQVIPDENGNISDATALAINNTESIELKAISKHDTQICTRVEIPADWHYIKVVCEGNVYYTAPQKTGEKKTVDIKLYPNKDTFKISPITKTTDGKLVSGYGITLSDGTVVDKNYFPGFIRKAVTFTLDDGLYEHDKKVIDILEPCGFTGTFNINNPATVSDPSIYDGFEVTNHHLLHTTAMRDGFDYSQFTFSDQPLPKSGEQDKNVIYRNYGIKNENGEWIEGFYYVHYSIYGSTAGWHPLATNETYIEYLAKTTAELEKIFGEGSVVGFAYPHGGSANEVIREYIKNSGYLYARKTGNLKGTTGFALPTDRYAWTYNADHNCLLEVMEDFDAYADDGKLKMFAFGVHAKDFETYGKWEDLKTYAKLYGNRQKEFWYATNRQIFEYEDAVNALIINDEQIINNSKIDLVVTINGEKTIIFANSKHSLR